MITRRIKMASQDATTKPVARPRPETPHAKPKVHPFNPQIVASTDVRLPCDLHEATKRRARAIFEKWVGVEFAGRYNLAGLEYVDDRHGTYWRIGVFERFETVSIGYLTLPYSLLGIPVLHKGRF